MENKTLPKETVADLLLFLADYEVFPVVEEKLGDSLTVEELRGALRELAGKMKKEIATETETLDLSKDSKISKEARELIGFLSPGEERSLLKAFGFVEKSGLVSR